MEEVPSHDPRAGRASGTPDCFTLLLVGIWRETPPFRHWRKADSCALCDGGGKGVVNSQYPLCEEHQGYWQRTGDSCRVRPRKKRRIIFGRVVALPIVTRGLTKF